VNSELRTLDNIVLVHGAFVDGAHWEGVYKILKRDGYSVSVVQNPAISLEDDVAVTSVSLQGREAREMNFVPLLKRKSEPNSQ